MHDTYYAVMARNTPFYFQKDNGSNYEGVDVHVLTALSQALRANFSVRTSPARSWGSCATGNCTGMIGMLQRNSFYELHFTQEFDVAMSGMSVSHDRQQHVDFSFPYLLDRLTFVVRAPQPLDPADSIIRPFSLEVWEYLFATAVVSVIIQQSAKLLPPMFHDFLGPLDIHGLLLGKGLLHLPQLLSQRIIVWSWLLISLVLSTSYTGVLFSTMTHPGLEDIVDSIPKLTEALEENRIVCGTLRNTHLEKSLEQEQPPEPFAAAILRSLESGANYVASDVVGLERCQEGRFAYIGEYIGILADVEHPETVHFARDSFQMGSYGVAMKRHLNITEQLNRVILRLWDFGLIEFWLANTTFNPRRCLPEQTFEQKLGVKHIIGALNILWGLFISLMVFFVEICFPQLGKKATRQKMSLLASTSRTFGGSGSVYFKNFPEGTPTR